MATHENAIAAKDIFKKNFWQDHKNKINVIAISSPDILEEFFPEDIEMIIETFFVKVYLFDISDASNFPDNINNVKIEYLPIKC